jgi:pimeloyl-ACP methyl ester carboxylesterase
MAYADNKGVKIYYEVAGEGPVMILVHAMPFDHSQWVYQVARFSTWFKVISMDVRAHGRSANVRTPFTFRDLGEDVLAVLRAEKADKAILQGVSIGSRLGALLALDHPEIFRAVVLVGASVHPGLTSPNRWERINEFEAKGAEYRIVHLEAGVSKGFAESARGKYLLATFTERNAWFDGKAIGQVFRSFNEDDLRPEMQKVKVPTLIVNGEFDHSLPHGKVTAGLIPGAIHKVLPNTGHACNMEDPAGYDAIVIDWLSAKGLMPKV